MDVLLSQQDRRRGNQTSLCGGGIQTREVYCVQISSDPGSLRAKEGNRCVLYYLCINIRVRSFSKVCRIGEHTEAAASARGRRSESTRAAMT